MCKMNFDTVEVNGFYSLVPRPIVKTGNGPGDEAKWYIHPYY